MELFIARNTILSITQDCISDTFRQQSSKFTHERLHSLCLVCLIQFKNYGRKTDLQ